VIESTQARIGAVTFATLLDQADVPIFALDLDGKIVHANAAAARAVGRNRGQLKGRLLAGLVEASDRHKVRSALTTVGTVPVTLDVRLKASAAPIPLTVRQLPGVRPPIVSAAFEADRPRAAVQASEPDVAAALDRFFLRFPHGVIGLDDECRVVFGNPRARQLLGKSSFRIGSVLSNEVLGEFAGRVVALPAVAQSARIELPDGRVLRASGLGPRRSEPAVLVLEDMTAEVRQDRVMREFVRNAAHQLRTPLTGIATAVEVLQAGAKNDPETRDRFLGHVEAYSQRLIRIARGLLVLARAQSGEPMRLELVELLPLLEELAAQSQPQAGVDLSIECDPALAALAERDLVHEVLAALIDNAIQHTREGSIRLSAAAADGSVAISVTDTGGTGVLPEHRERIFEPFYRPEASGKGFGLGLAIAAQATKAMDGELTVEDAERGARFTIRLPSGRIPA
jgi:two-component system, OmpR family, phosphate regulon sensor histidine kinase PhoR